MDIIQKFGNAVSSMSLISRARRLLLTDTDFREKRLLLFQIKAAQVGTVCSKNCYENIIQALSKA